MMTFPLAVMRPWPPGARDVPARPTARTESSRWV